MRRALAMTTTTVLTLAMVVVGSGVQAQPAEEGPWFHSAQSAGGVHGTTVTSLAMTGNGAPVTTGRFSGTAYFPTGPSPDDSIALTARGSADMFLAAQNANDSYFSWAVSVGGSSFTGGYGVAVSGDDTPIVTGCFSGTTYFPTGPGVADSIALTSRNGSCDVFVAALHPQTRYFTWAVSAGGSNGGRGNAISVTRDDTPIVAGFFTGTTYFPTGLGADDSIALTQLGNSDGAFVAAIDPRTGYFVWAVGAFTRAWDFMSARSVAVTRDGEPVITGSYRGTAHFPTGPGADDSISLASGPNEDNVFVAAVNPADRKFTWATSAGGPEFDEGYSIAMTRDDTPIITGFFRRSAYFPTGPGADDSIALTSGGTNNNMFVAALNPGSGYFAWVTPAGTSGSNRTNGIAVKVTADDTAVVAGSFFGTTTFPASPAQDDSIPLTSRGGGDIYIAALNVRTRYFSWALAAGSSGFDEASSVAVAGSHAPVIGGIFAETAFFPTGPSADDSIPLVARGNPKAFLARLGIGSIPPPNPPVPPNPGPGPAPVPTYPPSAPRSVTASSGDARAGVSWFTPYDQGSFPVTAYQVQSSPGGGSCLATAPALSCTIAGLTNGTAYTFTVRALNGAGWGTTSAPSEPVTPRAPVAVSIQVVGTRDTGDRRYARITGTTTGLTGERVSAWMRFGREKEPRQGLVNPLVASDGTFRWSRKAARSFSVYFAHDAVTSNTVVIKRR